MPDMESDMHAGSPFGENPFRQKESTYGQDFVACRELCVRQPGYQAENLSPVAHGVRHAAIRKSFPAERTYFDNHPRLRSPPRITAFGGMSQKDTHRWQCAEFPEWL